MLFTDVVGSTALKQQLGDRAGVELLQQHHRLVRQTFSEFPGAEEILVAGDSFLIVFPTPSEGVKCALLLQARLRGFNQGRVAPAQDRLGLHLGEVIVEGGRPGQRNVQGMQVDTCARVMSLARAGQILMTRPVFDNARQSLKGEELEGAGRLSWLNHGRFELQGLREPVEVCEVRPLEAGALAAPTTSEKARRLEAPEGEAVLGWRPAVGQVVPNTQWVLEQSLGGGSFGEVWLGRHQVMKERRVFKFCFRADRVRSLKREMTLFRLIKERIGDHPNIVSLREVYFGQPPYYVEMDYVAGQNLASWCEAQGGADKVPLETKLEIAAQVAEALQAAHDAGVIHRDVKPANILVGSPKSEVRSAKSVQVKLTDFGIGQVVSQEYLADVTKAGFTQTLLGPGAAQTGTQLYLAPELLAGKAASTRSDIYSLGVVLFQLLAGDFKRPLTTDWAKQVAEPLLREDLEHCFAGNPEERFAGAGQLAGNLRAWEQRKAARERQHAEQAEGERLRRRAQQRRRLLVAVSGLALVLVAIAVALGYGLDRAQIERRAARQNRYLADMNLGCRALEEGQLGRAMQLVEKYEAPGWRKLRDWEWRYLWGETRSDALYEFPERHGQAVTCLACSPDGKWAASGGGDSNMIVWDLKARQSIARLPHSNAVVSAAFSPAGWLATTELSGSTVRIWDPATRFSTHKPLTNSGPARAAAYSPDGRILAVACTNAVKMWDVNSWRQTGAIPVTNGNTIVFSPDGGLVAIHQPFTRVVLWDLRKNEPWTNFPGGVAGPNALAFSPDGRMFAMAYYYYDPRGGSADVWDVKTGARIAHLTNHHAWVSCLAFSREGRTLATGSADHSVKLWGTSNWQEIGPELRGHRNEIAALVSSPAEDMLITGDKDGVVRLWAFAPPARPASQTNVPSDFATGRLSRDGRLCLATYKDRTGELWDTATLAAGQRRPLPVSQWSWETIAVSPDGKSAAFGAAEGRMVLRDSATLSAGPDLQMGTRLAVLPTFSRDGTRLAAVLDMNKIGVMEVRPRTLVATLPGPPNDAYVALAFSPDGATLAGSLRSSSVEIWDLARQSKRALLTGQAQAAGAMVFFPDGKTLATAGWDGTTIVWDVALQKPIARLGGQKNSFDSIALTADGRRLAAGGGDGSIKIWDVQTWQEVATLRGPPGQGHLGEVYQLAFWPDGGALVSLSANQLRVWRAPSFADIEAAEAGKGSPR